ncbi:MAG TPA: M48 family metalloprotease [Albitalea sp.]|uniref:M48 family metalloprotease n=1 Tax=Piscinibacter sp. TaxID=1903157 RepID=UPI002ED22B8C
MADKLPSGLPRLAPLPYHDAVVAYLRSEEPELWQWAGSAQAREEHADEVRSELLKNTYRLDAQAHPDLHACCAAAAARLGLQAPVTLYQAGDGAMNASLYHLPGEAHIVFTGPLLERLKGAELEAVLGHELAHHVLWELACGAYHAADRLLGAALNDPRASASQVQTARLFQLYTEAFADRGGAVACAALAPAVTALVKTQTGLADVSATSYLQQADEICAGANAMSDARSHPEVFVRARALRLWCEAAPEADDWLAATLEGPLALDSLDLLGQQRLTALTRRVLAQFLQLRCLRSDGLLAHARRYFPDLRPDDNVDAGLASEVTAAIGTHDYLAAVLTDFAVADRELDDVPLAAALELAQRLGLDERFERFVQKELRLPKRQFQRLRQDAASLLERARQQHG